MPFAVFYDLLTKSYYPPTLFTLNMNPPPFGT